ncbi:c-type cytochrome biogenesis protein CcsB, partial [bacterium]|nr:c-type cytochrome biogenesis protein CcsB [bacterium]
METVTLHIAIFLYLASLTASLALWLSQAPRLEQISRSAFCAGAIVHTANLLIRTYYAGRLPYTNLYESLLIFAWGIAAISLYIIIKRGMTALATVTLPTIAAALVYASQMDSAINPLPPALHSGWLFVHVTLAIVSYGAFAVSGGLGLLYLIAKRAEQRQHSYPAFLPALDTIDSMIFATVLLAFPCLLLVIVTGSIWAQQAWGSYWSWDPKETWALITAIVYAVFIHSRLRWHWQGSRSAWFAIVGFITVLFCYLGVNLLMSGLHSYA